MPGRHRPESPATNDAVAGSLMNRASGALVWSFVNAAASRLGTVGIGIVLARLLGPEAFGTYAVAAVALMAVLSFNELGVSLAIVRWPGDPAVIAPTVTTISMLASGVIALVGWLLAPAFTTAMGDPSATAVVRVLILSVLASGAVAAPAALLQRQFKQGTRMGIDQVNVWVGALTSIALAMAGMGAMSLAIGRLAGSLASAALFIRFCPTSYRWGWNRDQVKPLLQFGLPLAGASIVVFGVSYVDQLVAGHTLGAIALGFYVLATNLSSWPVSMFSQPLRSVAPAAFARLQHDPAAMRSNLKSIVGLLAAVTLPVCLVLAGAAEPLVRLVYGDAWAPAAEPLLWLAVLVGFRIFFELAYDYMVVLGASRAILMLQVLWLVALAPALLVGAHIGGVAGIAAAHVVVAAAVAFPLYLFQFRRTGVPALELVSRIWRPVAVAGLAGLAAAGLSRSVSSLFLAIILSGVVGSASMVALIYRDRTELRRLRGPVAARAAV